MSFFIGTYKPFYQALNNVSLQIVKFFMDLRY